ncbi:hypothetical protein V8E53_006107 [Lactarius tabidus]
MLSIADSGNFIDIQGSNEDPPAWFGPAVRAALAPELASLTREVRKAQRLIAIHHNEAQIRQEHPVYRFEVVYFPNLEDPTSEPHNLPPSTSREGIDRLSDAHAKAYYQGYYPVQAHVAALCLPDYRSTKLLLGIQSR